MSKDRNQHEINTENNLVLIKPTRKQVFFDILKKCCFGTLMGISDNAIGYSGATTLSYLSFYDKFIFHIKSVFTIWKNSNWLKSFLWILPFLVFWIGSLIGFSYLFNLIADNGFGLEIIFLFFTFSLCGTYIFYLNYRPRFQITKAFAKDFKKINFSFWWFVIGCLIGISAGIALVCTGGIDLNGQSEITKVADEKILLILVGGFLAGFAMIVPGISGAFILYVMNIYKDIYWIALHNIAQNWYILLIFLITAILGIISSVFACNFFIKKYSNNFYNLCLGSIIFSAISMLMSISPNMWNILVVDKIHILYVFIAIGIGIIIIIVILMCKKQGKKVGSLWKQK